MATAELTKPESTALVAFGVTEAQIAALKEKYLPLKIANVDDAASYKLVHSSRMSVRRIRLDLDETRKALKEEAQRRVTLVDSEARKLRVELEAIEAHLQAEEDRYEAWKAAEKRKAEEAKRAATQARYDALAAVNCILPWVEVERLSDEAYTLKLTEATEAHRVAAEKAAAEEAERQRAQAAEEARLKAEREKLAQQQEELERLKAEQLEREAAFRKRQERITAMLAIDLSAADATNEAILSMPDQEWLGYISAARREYQAQLEATQAEERRKAEEQAERERAEAEARRQAELEEAKRQAAERARIETEERLAREAEEKRSAAEAAEAERLRQEALKPDREKLIALAGTIETVKLPEVSPGARDAAVAAYRAIMDCGAKIRAAAEGL